jgi:hypothetical protein
MKLFGWYYRIKVRRQSMKKMKLRSMKEILNKELEISSQIVALERSENKQGLTDLKLYKEAFDWMLCRT